MAGIVDPDFLGAVVDGVDGEGTGARQAEKRLFCGVAGKVEAGIAAGSGLEILQPERKSNHRLAPVAGSFRTQVRGCRRAECKEAEKGEEEGGESFQSIHLN